MTRRTCTFEYKIKPIQRKVREILGVNNLRGKHIEMVMGISFDEIQRVKLLVLNGKLIAILL